MKNLQQATIIIICATVLTGTELNSYAQDPAIVFGKSESSQKIFSKSKEKDKSLLWVNVNTEPETWTLQKDILVCSGHPIGVMRSEKQYENFILHIEWKQMEEGGNAGVFVWSNADPPEDTR